MPNIPQLTWTKMRQPSSGKQELVGSRGRYLLLLSPPYVLEMKHWVHFSWKDGSYKIRDFIIGQETDSQLYTVEEVWNAAEKRIPCTGKLYKSTSYINFEWWKNELQQMTSEYFAEAHSIDYNKL